jgi:hypothetical protein
MASSEPRVRRSGAVIGNRDHADGRVAAQTPAHDSERRAEHPIVSIRTKAATELVIVEATDAYRAYRDSAAVGCA